MGAVLDFRRPLTIDQAWDAYLKLVNERAEQNLWTDLEHNQRLARAWNEWCELFLREETDR